MSCWAPCTFKNLLSLHLHWGFYCIWAWAQHKTQLGWGSVQYHQKLTVPFLAGIDNNACQNSYLLLWGYSGNMPNSFSSQTIRYRHISASQLVSYEAPFSFLPQHFCVRHKNYLDLRAEDVCTPHTNLSCGFLALYSMLSEVDALIISCWHRWANVGVSLKPGSTEASASGWDAGRRIQTLYLMTWEEDRTERDILSLLLMNELWAFLNAQQMENATSYTLVLTFLLVKN